MAPAIYVSNSLTRVTFISNFGNSRPQNLSFSFLVTWSSGSGDGNAQATFRDTHWIFPIHGEYLGQDIPFLGRFWGFIREKCLLFFYIPILGIGCEFFPKLFPKLGTIREHFPSYSLYRGIIGTCKSQYRGVIETRKIHQRVIIGTYKSHWREILGAWKTLYEGKLCEILVLRLIWVASFGIFSQTDFTLQIVNCKKFSVMGESPAIFFFLQESGKIYFFISWKLLYHYGGWSFKSFTYFLLT